MNNEPLTSPEIRMALAAIRKGHELGAHELTEEDIDRARRILTGELSTEAARIELRAALQALVDRERGH
ncbi:hypothetical protein [Microbacterium foliorum]|uniref:hypothetical protein n=1 Tax=Microbacterium foliorum TaxID=104336 RepID=UPI0037360A76